MSRKFKVIGLALVAICAFGVVTAGAAQAAPEWTVGGKTITTEKLAETVLLTKVNSSESQPSSTLTVPKLGITLTCTGLKATNGEITGTTTGSATALDFTGCIVASAPNACQVKSAGATIGTIGTAGVSANLITNASGTFAVFSPTSGTTFVEIVIEKKPEKTCAVSGSYKVAGTAALQLVTGTSSTYVEGTASQTVQTNAGAALTFGAQPAFLDATGDLALASDANWGVDA